MYQGDYSKDSLEAFLQNPLIPNAAREEITNATGYKQLEKLRQLYYIYWTPEELANGFVFLADGTLKTLESCLEDPFPTPKLTIIQKVGNEFALIHESYIINENDLKNEAQEAELEAKICYFSKKQTFKCLKLLCRYFMQSSKHNNEILRLLIEFFNGPVGRLNKVCSELGILETLILHSVRPLMWKDIYNNFKLIQKQLDSLYGTKYVKELDKFSQSNALETIGTLKDYFYAKINQESKDFLCSLYK
jgi:hypothetical protein